MKFYVDGEKHGDDIPANYRVANPLNLVEARACLGANECHVTDVRIYKAAKGAEEIRGVDRIEEGLS